MAIRTVTDAIRYVGGDDNTLALFENQYPVQPMGVSYNSYVILDEKIAVMDSVDARAAEEWLSNMARVLEGRSPDYLVVTHMEPDHSGSLMRLAQKYPEMKIVGNAKTFTLIKQFFGTGALSEDRMLEVGEGSILSLGSHRLQFLLAPMVHWPEVMTAYEERDRCRNRKKRLRQVHAFEAADALLEGQRRQRIDLRSGRRTDSDSPFAEPRELHDSGYGSVS